MICSSWPVPSVVTTSACVSPRVNSEEPWARGSTPTSATIGRTVLVSRPSMRLPVSRMALRTTSASRLPNCSPKAASAASSPSNSFLASAFTSPILAWRACFCVSAKAVTSLPRISDFSFSATVFDASDGSVSGSGSLAQCSASWMIASITGWNERWASMTAPSMTSSESSLASDSTISTPSLVPATTRSSTLVSICALVGFTMYLPSA